MPTSPKFTLGTRIRRREGIVNLPIPLRAAQAQGWEGYEDTVIATFSSGDDWYYVLANDRRLANDGRDNPVCVPAQFTDRAFEADKRQSAFVTRKPGMSEPRGAVIEIIEVGATTSDATAGDSVIVPNEVRINGQPLLVSADEPVIVHEISSHGNDVVRATLTRLARRVTYRAEHDTGAQAPDVDDEAAGDEPPAGVQVGTAYVKVLPDFDGFHEAVDAAVDAALARITEALRRRRT